MTGKDFDEIMEARITQIRAVLASKATEYATDQDRLHNFKQAASLKVESVGQAALGMLVKHWVSVQDLVHKLDSGIRIRDGVIDEKIGDAINYLILLEGILKEKP